jgi:hypothetical protein
LWAALRHDPAQRDPAEVTAALPLRAHEAALRAAETRLVAADEEIRALQAAVAEANDRLGQLSPAVARIDHLEQQAKRAATDATEARRQLEATMAAARQTTASTAKVVEQHAAPNWGPPAPATRYGAAPPAGPRPAPSGRAPSTAVGAVVIVVLLLLGVGGLLTAALWPRDPDPAPIAYPQATSPAASTTAARTTTTEAGPDGTYGGTEGGFQCSGDATCSTVTPSNGEYVIRGTGSSATLAVPGVGNLAVLDSDDCAHDLDVDESDIGLCFAGPVAGATCQGKSTSDLYVVTIPEQDWDSTIYAVSGRVIANNCGSGTIVGRLTLERAD